MVKLIPAVFDGSISFFKIGMHSPPWYYEVLYYGFLYLYRRKTLIAGFWRRFIEGRYRLYLPM